MGRYDKTLRPVKNKKSYYSTTVYKKVIEKNTDGYFIATQGDRCDNLAVRFYGDASLWWFIARVNNLTTNNIPAGTSLRIPATTQDAEGF
tara:strand:- start:88 stop:357 length:270 start_codon:yes stop_codon:yes gene_type:complete